GYLKVASVKKSGGAEGSLTKESDTESDDNGSDEQSSSENDAKLGELVKNLKKGDLIEFNDFSIKEGETSPPKRYNSGSIILAMENAGQLIEDESLREQIKGSGIGTSATRAEILKKLVNIKYLALNNKTQIITPTQMGEMVHDVVAFSIKQLLNPELTASWEKGLTYVAEGTISGDEYMGKLEDFVKRRVDNVKTKPIVNLKKYFDYAAQFYK
ncbi:MAG: type IA DNA topoisomerase, partial [Parasporobacterium sp.]|nr:type IA DNA topoisomerase [Parasporobacterium sp.]